MLLVRCDPGDSPEGTAIALRFTAFDGFWLGFLSSIFIQRRYVERKLRRVVSLSDVGVAQEEPVCEASPHLTCHSTSEHYEWKRRRD